MPSDQHHDIPLLRITCCHSSNTGQPILKQPVTWHHHHHHQTGVLRELRCGVVRGERGRRVREATDVPAQKARRRRVRINDGRRMLSICVDSVEEWRCERRRKFLLVSWKPISSDPARRSCISASKVANKLLCEVSRCCVSLSRFLRESRNCRIVRIGALLSTVAPILSCRLFHKSNVYLRCKTQCPTITSLSEPPPPPPPSTPHPTLTTTHPRAQPAMPQRGSTSWQQVTTASHPHFLQHFTV